MAIVQSSLHEAKVLESMNFTALMHPSCASGMVFISLCRYGSYSNRAFCSVAATRIDPVGEYSKLNIPPNLESVERRVKS